MDFESERMSIANTNLTSVKIPMPKLSQLVPDFAQSIFRAVAPKLADKRNGPVLPHFSTNDLLERLIVPVSDEDPDIDAALPLIDQCDSFTKNNDWLGLANFLTQFDQSREAVPSGNRMLEVLVRSVRDGLSEMYEPPGVLNYDTANIYSDRALDAIEAAQLEAPDNYMMAALLARFHLDCAYGVRGSKLHEDLDGMTRSVLRDHTNVVRDVITQFDPIAYNSPLLAEIQHGYAALVDPSFDRLMCAFDDWVELDPANLTPYGHHAFYVQSLHSENNVKSLDNEARRAITLSEDVTGLGAYTAMYLSALKVSPAGFSTLDTDMFVTGFDDLMQALDGDPVRLIYLFEQVVEQFPDRAHPSNANLNRKARAKSAKIRMALAPIVRKYLTLLYSVAWELDETDFLHAIAPSFDEELSNGFTVELAEGGLLVTFPNHNS